MTIGRVAVGRGIESKRPVTCCRIPAAGCVAKQRIKTNGSVGGPVIVTVESISTDSRVFARVVMVERMGKMTATLNYYIAQTFPEKSSTFVEK